MSFCDIWIGQKTDNAPHPSQYPLIFRVEVIVPMDTKMPSSYKYIGKYERYGIRSEVAHFVSPWFESIHAAKNEAFSIFNILLEKNIKARLFFEIRPALD